MVAGILTSVIMFVVCDGHYTPSFVRHDTGIHQILEIGTKKAVGSDLFYGSNSFYMLKEGQGTNECLSSRKKKKLPDTNGSQKKWSQDLLFKSLEYHCVVSYFRKRSVADLQLTQMEADVAQTHLPKRAFCPIEYAHSWCAMCKDQRGLFINNMSGVVDSNEGQNDSIEVKFLV